MRSLVSIGVTLALCGLAVGSSKSDMFLQYGEKGEHHERRGGRYGFPASGGDTNLQPVIGIVAQTLEPEMLVDPRF